MLILIWKWPLIHVSLPLMCVTVCEWVCICVPMLTAFPSNPIELLTLIIYFLYSFTIWFLTWISLDALIWYLWLYILLFYCYIMAKCGGTFLIIASRLQWFPLQVYITFIIWRRLLLAVTSISFVDDVRMVRHNWLQWFSCCHNGWRRKENTT